MILPRLTAAAAAPRARPTETVASLGAQARTLVDEASGWVAANSLRILIAAAVATVVVLLLLALRGLGEKLCRNRPMTSWAAVIGRVVARTGLWFLVILAARLVEGYADMPPAISRTIEVAWIIAFALQAALWAREFVIGLVEHRIGGEEGLNTGLGSAMGIIRLLVSVSLFALATVLILDNLGVNVTGLIAGLGIGGIAIGLAAKGIFDDLFAALAILFDRPFRRGDSVRWDQTSGTVEEIGLKTTRVRSINGEQVIISNANLLNKEVHNLARLDRRRITLGVGVVYELPPETLRAIPAMLRSLVEGVDKCVVVRCGLIGLGGSSVDYEVQFDVTSDVYNEVYDARTAVCLAVLERFAAEGIAVAYPTQTTYTAAPDGRLVMPYAAPAEVSRAPSA